MGGGGGGLSKLVGELTFDLLVSNKSLTFILTLNTRKLTKKTSAITIELFSAYDRSSLISRM